VVIVLRVCVLISRDIRGPYGGASYRVVTLAKYLSKEIHKVVIVDSVRNSYIEVLHGQFAIRKLPYSVLVFLLSHIHDLITKLLILLLHFPKEEAGRVANVFNVSLFLDSLRIALYERPHIIQVEEYFSLVPLAFILKKIVGSKLLILSTHNIETYRLLRDPNCRSSLFIRLVSALEHIAYMLSDCIFVVSELDAKRLKAFTGYGDKVEVVPNFVDFKAIEKQLNTPVNRFKKLLEKRKPLLIFHGDFRYLPNREALRLLLTKIMPSVIKKYPKAMLVVAGAGLSKLVKQNIIYVGYVEDLYSLISLADIAVVPLLRGGGTRIKIIEYMACKVPVISTVIGAEGLNLENYKDAIITDIGSFVDSITLLVEHPNLRELLIMNALRKVKQNYDIEIVAKKVVSVYYKLFKLKLKLIS